MSSAKRLRKLERENERLRETLQIILTWATFEHPGYRRGHSLEPKTTEAICRQALGIK